MKTSPDTTEATAEHGHPVGWAWTLPCDPGCAKHARSVLAEALGLLGIPRDLIGDAQLMVSELATNAYQHAGDHGPHELWLYLSEPEGLDELEEPAGLQGLAEPGAYSDAAEVRCAIFDGKAEARLPGYSWTSGDCGRGLNIVHELSGGRWGLRPGRSRLGPYAGGKAVWFAIPAAPGEAGQILRGHRPIR